ncbi:MAG: methyltransferase domain-containing protein [Microscillaceae bacterium]|jgi:SAM-dependent methyltransferase|nr:methyltransferase domain-containing protein [Microscillaceae bacterium]
MFEKRSNEAELMDDLNLANEALKKNLDELEIINYWLGGNQVVINALQKINSQLPDNQPISIIDLGSGGGDTLREVAQWARRSGRKVELIGLDANQFMIDYAQKKAQKYPEIQFQKQDIFAESFREQHYDIVICSLFCHHFGDDELIELFQNLKKQARIAFIINDLHRHWFAYYSIKWITWLFRGSYLVQNDAPLSVLRAFRKSELVDLLHKAGIKQFQIRWFWAFRWQVIVF